MTTKKKYQWQQFHEDGTEIDTGYWVFEDIIYRVGVRRRWRNLSTVEKECNYVCIARTAEIATQICEALEKMREGENYGVQPKKQTSPKS